MSCPGNQPAGPVCISLGAVPVGTTDLPMIPVQTDLKSFP